MSLPGMVWNGIECLGFVWMLMGFSGTLVYVVNHPTSNPLTNHPWQINA